MLKSIKSLLLKLKSSQFLNQILVTVTGNGLGFVIGFLLTPVISRLYPPEAYGLFSIINSIVAVVLMLSTLNYTNAIVLPKSNHKFLRLVQICLFSLSVTTVIISLVLLVFGKFIYLKVSLPVNNLWLYTIPVLVFFSGLIQILNGWLIRLSEFKSISKSKFFGILGGKSTAILIGYMKPFNLVGILIGELVGKLFFISFLLKKQLMRRFNFLITNINIDQIKSVALEYKRYPLFALPANWLQALILQIPIYFLSHYYNLEYVGLYSMANGLLIIPLNILGNSVASVFLKKAVEVEQAEKSLRKQTENLFFKLLYIVTVPFAVLFVFGEEIFSIILGDQWRASGEVASIMSMYFVIQTCAIPISIIYRVKRKEKEFFFYQVISVCIIVLALFSSLSSQSFLMSMKYYSYGNILVYLTGIGMTFSFLGSSIKSIIVIILKSILTVFFVYGFILAINYLVAS
ncbi:lipopolysaccharide biosynthesis protein [Mangrovivirga cuniculi]|uniref:Membrane protein involved in the export of O-antigen and teichoic acid n=1 Tax=Mangrovivirga cuniculi TaxID=2715131 RepID=A0A4D7JLM2_9BACT|nr:oligosaccharide flippase family protein [Mangrovivirga cuniculi]QCK16491.1 hypothetical protein DCC35_18020 [Mangrovivirga cuniculi]